MSTAKAIPLEDVRNALMCAVVRLKATAPDGQRFGRCAAMTQTVFWGVTCRDRRPGKPRVQVRQTFTVMHAGDMDHLLQRVRLDRGLVEVRKTWGAGYRALQSEFNGSTVMR